MFVVQQFLNSNKLIKYSRDAVEELNQKQNKLHSLLLSVVHSKRLLSDHLEILQEYAVQDLNFNLSTRKSTNYFTFSKSLLFGGTAIIAKYCLPIRWKLFQYGLSMFAIGYTTVFSIKCLNCTKNYVVKNRLIELIQLLDQMEMYIKQNIIYFRESQILKQNVDNLSDESEHNKMLVNDCIRCTIEVTKQLYEVVKYLEKYPLPGKYENIYQPLEDLNGCDYFQRPISEFNSSNIKDFYNIYLYFQSQLLIRLSLTFIYDNINANKFLQKDILQLINRIKGYNLNSTIQKRFIIKQSKESILDPLTKSAISSMENNYLNDSADTLKSYSLGFTTRLAAICNECNKLNEFIQKIYANIESNKTESEQINVIPIMKNIENALSICQDDYQRLTVAYHQYLFYKYKIIHTDGEIMPNSNIDHLNIDIDDGNNNIKGHIMGINNDDEDKEYFAIRNPYELDIEVLDADNVPANDTKPIQFDEELKILDSKMVKKHFKPVLKQLKNKINPIKQQMDERERNYYLAKGIDVNKMNKQPEEDDNSEIQSSIDLDDNTGINRMDLTGFSYGSDSDDDDDDDGDERLNEISRKKHIKTNKYDANREFLQSKEQISLFPSNFLSQGFQIPPSQIECLLNEEILE